MQINEYIYSKGVEKITNEPTRDKIVQMAVNQFVDQKVELNENKQFIFRILIGKNLGEAIQPMDDPALAAVIISKGEDGNTDVNLLLWSEAEESGIADYLTKAIGEYQAGPGRIMFPNKLPKGEV
jgi:hypothetical protein